MENVLNNQDEEQTKDIYAHFGLALYLAQVLEHGIINALVILRMPEREKYTRSDIDIFMESEFRKTLGTLISHLRQTGSIDADLEGTLLNALEKRNYLAHSYFRHRTECFFTANGRNQMIAELQDAQQLFQYADSALAKVVAPICAKYGMTDEAIQEEMIKMLVHIDDDSNKN